MGEPSSHFLTSVLSCARKWLGHGTGGQSPSPARPIAAGAHQVLLECKL